ncbi:dehydrogenase/reductase SDR family protein 7-like [Lingula anatina]|uniref:Dehydrogenase/reductase SDR family protein 7-like n=1 Tax=Lingula anatina TaxID=7574 RepID=A0A1S3HFH7_LINAN|nr:dehydrogenase/reductase SDR family protein 7-like [Lingula anatina]|eukprot:XP_013384795.1 dehydrogenase/reductase SDR family protein 7-like [Lingula anatina]
MMSYSIYIPIALMAVWVSYRLFKKRHCDLRDKVVLITGASSGLGEACAHAFYKAGSRVILCARREAELKRVKQDLQNLKLAIETKEPSILTLDLSDLDSVPQRAAQALKIHGHIDILVNNGGISYRGEAMETELGIHMSVMTVNYFGQIALTQALLPSMVSRDCGHIVAISSVQGKIAIPYRSAYAASKHAAQAYFDSLRAEVADKNIKVSVISPGYIKTNLSLNALQGDGTRYGVMDKTTETGMSPEYVASKVLKAVQEQKNELILAPFTVTVAVFLRTFCPSLYFSLMKKRAAHQKQDQCKQK